MIRKVIAYCFLFQLALVGEPLRGDDAAPAVSIMQASASELLADLKFLLSLTSEKEQDQWENVEATIETFLDGIDRKKPLRVDVLFGGSAVRYRPSFPISDFRRFREDNLAAFGIECAKAGGGLYRVSGDFSGYLRYSNGYSSIGEKKSDVPSRLPAPLTALKPLIESGFDLGVQLENSETSAASQATRRKAIGKLRDNLLAATKRRTNESAKEYELRRVVLGHQLNEIERFYAEAARLEAGWTTSIKERDGRFRWSLQGIESSSLAASIDQIGKSPSQFSGVAAADDAILTTRILFPLDKLRQGHLAEFYKGMRPVVDARINGGKGTAAQKTARTQFASGVFDLLESAAAAGLVDGFLDVIPRKGGHLLLGGINAVNSDGDIEKLVALLPQMLAGVTVQTNIESVGEVAIHKVSVADDALPTLREFIGSGGVVYLATSKSALWYAAGPDSHSSLKRAVEAEAADDATSTQFLTFSVRLAPWLNLADKMQGNKGNAELRRIAKTAHEVGEDGLNVVFERVGDKAIGTFQVETGALRFVGKLIAKFSKENL